MNLYLLVAFAGGALPPHLAELYSSVDIDALSNLLAKQALDTVVANGFDAARRKLQNTCVDALRGCRGAFGTGGGGAMGGPMAAGPPGAYGHAQQMAEQAPARQE